MMVGGGGDCGDDGDDVDGGDGGDGEGDDHDGADDDDADDGVIFTAPAMYPTLGYLGDKIEKGIVLKVLIQQRLQVQVLI